MLVRDRCGGGANSNAALRLGVTEPEASGDAGSPWMLSVVRLARGRDVDALESATALRVEHGARLAVITVGLPGWWQCVPSAACGEVLLELERARRETDLWLREIAAHAGAELVIASGKRSAARAVSQELDRRPYSFVVGTKAALSRRAARRWVARMPALSVFRV